MNCGMSVTEMILKSPLPAFNDNTLPSDAESIITYGGLSDGLVLSSEDLMLILFLNDILCPQRAVPRPSTKHVTLSLCPSMLMFTGISVVYVYPSLLTYQSVSDANRSVTNTGDINCPKNLRSESFILTIFCIVLWKQIYNIFAEKTAGFRLQRREKPFHCSVSGRETASDTADCGENDFGAFVNEKRRVAYFADSPFLVIPKQGLIPLPALLSSARFEELPLDWEAWFPAMRSGSR